MSTTVNTESTAVQFNQQGETYLSQGKLEEAIACYDRAIKLDPNLAKVYQSLGEALKKQGKLEEATVYYQKAIELNATHARNGSEGQQTFAGANATNGAVKSPQVQPPANPGISTEAPDAYTNVIRINPDLSWSHNNLAKCLVKLERWEEAVNAYRKAIELNPDFSWSHNNLADVLLKLERWDEAVEAYRKATELNPDFSWSHNYLADALVKLERWDEAIAAYERSIELNPDHFWAHNNLAEALVKLERWDEAVAAYQRANEINPDFFWSQSKLGDVLLKLERWEDAVAVYRRAAQLNRDFAWTYYNMGTAFEKLERWDESIASYRSAAEIQPDLPWLSQKLADALRMGREWDRQDAMGLYRKAIAENPDDVQLYHKALEIAPNDAGLYVELADALVRQNWVDGAIVFYQMALQIRPDDKAISGRLEEVLGKKRVSRAAGGHQNAEDTVDYHKLGETLQGEGKIDEAVVAYRKAIAINPNYFGTHHNLKEPFDANLVKHSSLSEREIIAQSPIFDENWYAMRYAQFIGQDVDTVTHYLTKGASKGFNPSPLFDAEYYFSQVSSADKTTENPLIHYLTDGWKKYDPNPYFSTSFYLQFYSNELKTLTPLEHYATQMPPYLFYPSPIFSNSSYLNHNPDVASSGLNPLWHYLSSGKQEDRSIQEYYDDIIPYRIESTCEINSDDDVLIYVAFCPKGKLSDLQVDTINSFVNQGYKVIVVVNSGHYSLCVHQGITKASACITRENFGYDFGAWRLACRIFISLNKAHSITFTNDSIVLLDNFKHSESLRLHINKSGTDVVYLTRNTARKNHFQSYFFTVKATAIQKGALYLMRNNDYYLRKDKIILMLELDLWDKFSDLGLKISEVFAHHKSADERKNPTIHYWKELCDQGFPFLKLQLFTSGLYQLEDPEFMAVLKPSQIELIKKHLSERNQAITYYHDRNLELNYPPQSALPTPARFGEIGQLQAYNPPSSHIPSLEVPLCGIDNIKLSELSKVPILAVIHCFYVDIAAQILERISTVSSILQLQVVCTTDTSEKLTELNRLLGKYQLDGFVVITQNRGRDVAPLLIEGAKYIKDAKFILHLHTKKSPHHSKLSNWGDFLFDNLIGSKDIILSNLLLLSQGTVGLVYSEHFAEVKDLRNWGFDFNHAKEILQRLGVNLSSEMLLEFPSSTMFWARIEAIQPLFDLNFDYRDFEEESGQIDGTLAHAIERSILYVVEHQGFYGIKVLEKFSQQKNACWKLRADELDYGLSRLRPVKLLGSSGSPSPNANIETYPINITVSPCRRPRFNLLIPTMQPQRIYGGVSTAIKVGKELFSQLDKSVDFRLIVTSDKLDEESILESCSRLDLQFFSSRPNEDISSPTIVPLYHYRHVPLSIRSSDVFFATAWWTADLGFRLRRQQFDAFGSPQMPLIYLIQDYEPGFYTWSRRSAIARATYEEENIIALINSEELANFLTKEYSFRAAYHYPYILNETLASKLHPTQKEPIILIYGRPSVERNLFPIILEGLQMWQADNPGKNTMFKLIFAGEDFDEKLIAYLENASVVGKLSLEDYSETLNKTAIGISLMESPHPSYPPLEMASAGCITITNGYYNKNLALRSPNILSIKSITPLNLKCALDQALKMIDLKEITPLGNIGKIPTTVPVANYLEIAKILKEVWEPILSSD